jgi:putative SOS response-associated peptidase YedK
MCYINGVRVSRDEYIRYKQTLRQLMEFNKPAQSGFNYDDWPIIKVNDTDDQLEVLQAHWEFIPFWVKNWQEVEAARKQGIPWLNATAEKLFESKMFKSAALKRRCLVPTSGFFEYRHVPKLGKKGQPLSTTDKIPYHITFADEKLHYMAGIYQEWTDKDTDTTITTFAIVTTAANGIMEQIHNSRKRMPTILPTELIEEWLDPKTPEERVKKIAAHQYDGEELYVCPVAKDFLRSENPTLEADYGDTLPPLL